MTKKKKNDENFKWSFSFTEFYIDFSFVVYNDWWQPWHAEFEKFMLFRYFSIFGFMEHY